MKCDEDLPEGSGQDRAGTVTKEATVLLEDPTGCSGENAPGSESQGGDGTREERPGSEWQAWRW